MPAFLPKKQPGLMVAIGLKDPGPVDKPKGRLSARNNAEETPEEETSYHDRGERPAPTPESVDYRTSQETCGGCEYMNGARCDFLDMEVGEGDSCRRFEAKGEDMGEESGEDREPIGGERAEYGR